MTDKHIAIVCSHFYPQNTAASQRLEVLARTLKEQGFVVRVFTLKEKKSTQKNLVFNWFEIKKGFWEEIPVYYIFHTIQTKNFFFRAIHEWISGFCLFYAISRVGSSRVLLSIPYMFLLPVFSFFFRGYLIADVRDLVWEYLSSESFWCRFIKKQIQKVMIQSLRRCKEVIVTNLEEQKILKKSGIQARIMANGISLRDFFDLESVFLSQSHKGPFSRIFYAGTLGLAQNFDTIFEFLLKSPSFSLDLAGEGNAVLGLKQKVCQLGIQNRVFFHGKIKKEKVFELYKSADFLFFSLKPQYQTALPSKIFEYLCTGLPVLFEGRGPVRDIFSSLENVVGIDFGDLFRMQEFFEGHNDGFGKKSVQNREWVKKNAIREELMKSYAGFVF